MKLSIGPVLFEWGKKGVADFYRRMAFESTADILYIGEVVCSKRYHLDPDELRRLVEELRGSGKEIVLSSLGLVMSAGEQDTLHRLAATARDLGVRLEVNDMAGMGVAEGQPLVAGPHINTYNPETMAFLQRVGVERVVMPVELSQQAIIEIIAQRPEGRPEVELFAHGRLPLTFSARCYTARAFQLSKANCQYKCGEFPDGMTMRTQDRQRFLSINGIQTMSERIHSLVAEAGSLPGAGVDVLRLSPQSRHMVEVVELWRARIDDRIDGGEALAGLEALNDGQPFCNGYYYGAPGLEYVGG